MMIETKFTEPGHKADTMTIQADGKRESEILMLLHNFMMSLPSSRSPMELLLQGVGITVPKDEPE